MYFDGYNLTKYVANLEAIGVRVVLTEINNCEECIINSQCQIPLPLCANQISEETSHLVTKADSLPPWDCRHHPMISFSSCSLQQKIAAQLFQPHLVMGKRPDRLSTTLLLTSLTPITHLRPPTLCTYFLILRVSDLKYSQHLATKRIPTCCRTGLHGTLTTPFS